MRAFVVLGLVFSIPTSDVTSYNRIFSKTSNRLAKTGF